MAAKTNKAKFLTYKGKPLVRSGNVIYYGSMEDDFVIMMQILTTRMVGNFEVADRVAIQLLNTDPEVRPREQIVKKSEKKGLYAAMDIAAIWLSRALDTNK